LPHWLKSGLSGREWSNKGGQAPIPLRNT
jgi:hypothetical protein